MRLSEWRSTAPARDAAAPKVSAVVDPVLLALGAPPDPHCWVAWGEEPANRFTIFVPTDPGLIVCFVRVNVPGDGPRATTKLARWNRVSIGELTVETQAGHRMLSFQLEAQVLRGADAEADRAAAFALRVIAAIDGRPLPPVDALEGGPTRSKARPNAPTKGAAGAAKAPSKGPAKAAPGSPSSTAPATSLSKPAAGKTAAGKPAAQARSDAHR